jgi:hypothetical protein
MAGTIISCSCQGACDIDKRTFRLADNPRGIATIRLSINANPFPFVRLTAWAIWIGTWPSP